MKDLTDSQILEWLGDYNEIAHHPTQPNEAYAKKLEALLSIYFANAWNCWDGCRERRGARILKSQAKLHEAAFQLLSSQIPAESLADFKNKYRHEEYILGKILWVQDAPQAVADWFKETKETALALIEGAGGEIDAPANNNEPTQSDV
jgi:hypothetical protein